MRSLFFTIITGGIFFFFATATSQERNFLPSSAFNAEVSLMDSNLILKNNDTLNISNALLSLTDSAPNTTDGRSYLLVGYNLGVGLTDTIPLAAFKSDTLSYPVETFPFSFHLNFSSSREEHFLNVVF